MFTKLDVEKYFNSEKSLSLLFIIIGSIAIIIALLFLFIIKSPIYKGVAIPLLVIAIMQIIVGVIVYKRTDTQRKDIVYNLDMNYSTIKEKEIPRMDKIIKKFAIYQSLEIAVFVIGLFLILFYKNNPNKSFLRGVGIGLAIQTTIMLAGNYYTAKNAKFYMTGLKAYKHTSMHL